MTTVANVWMNQVWGNPALSSRAVLVACFIRSRCIGIRIVCWPALGTIAKNCRMSTRSVQRHIKELESAGVLGVKRGYNTSNRYTLIHDTGVACTDVQATGEVAIHDNEGSDTRQAWRTNKQVRNNKKENEKTNVFVIGINKVQNLKDKTKPRQMCVQAIDRANPLTHTDESVDITALTGEEKSRERERCLAELGYFVEDGVRIYPLGTSPRFYPPG
jgi:hypothetical protein